MFSTFWMRCNCSISQAGAVALPGESVYCMTKAAIAHLTRCLAVEWGRHGITVNAVAPTFIATPGTESALSDPEFRADVSGLVSIGVAGVVYAALRRA